MNDYFVQSQIKKAFFTNRFNITETVYVKWSYDRYMDIYDIYIYNNGAHPMMTGSSVFRSTVIISS